VAGSSITHDVVKTAAANFSLCWVGENSPVFMQRVFYQLQILVT
jgi:hypothetical protein